MTRNILGKDEILARYFSTILPDAEREYFHILKSSVDVGVWLVGLSTGIIAVLMSSESIRSQLSECIITASLILFSMVIMFGVLQRILYHIAELKKWPLSLGLRSTLLGLTDKTLIASELQDHWSVNDIVDHLRDDFGVDYTFLIQNHSSIEQAREAYKGQLDIHQKFEQKGMAQLAELLCSHYGLPKEAEESYFKSVDLEEKRTQARIVNRIFSASFYSYYISAALFVMGIVTLAYGAI